MGDGSLWCAVGVGWGETWSGAPSGRPKFGTCMNALYNMLFYLCSRIHVFLFFLHNNKAQVFRLSLLTFCNLICILCIESPVYDFTWVLVLLFHMLLMF